MDWEATGFYEGFVPNKTIKDREKEPAVAYTKRENHIPLAVARTFSSYSGVLGKNTALIELDDREQGEMLLKIIKDLEVPCLVSDRDNGRGYHILVKDPEGRLKTSQNVTLAIGIKNVDIKVGKRNGLECLKLRGTERKVIYNKTPYCEVPKWLTPVKSSYDFQNMEQGERNQSFFNYILTLQTNDFTVEEARETIKIINRYILKNPLPENELDVILRDESFKTPAFFKGNTFLFDRFANYLKREHHIIRINNRLHIYKDGKYEANEKLIYNAMLTHLPQLSKAKRKEVMSYLEDLIIENTPVADVNLIAFKNGVYNLKEGTLLPFSPGIVITNKINWNYNPTAYSELVDVTLNKIACHDKQIRMLLEEILGAVMYRSNTLAGGKAFILIGDQSNGKSTYLDMIKTMLGEDNIASLDLGELGDRFKTAELFGKLANIGDDIGDEFISNTSIFKKLVTGERLNVERKGQDPFEFTNYAKLLFSANNIPRMGKGRDTGAILRRLVIIPFNAKFSEDDPDFTPGIKYELRKRDCMEYLTLLGLEGLKRVLKNKAYTKSAKVEQELNDYEIANNPLLSFIKECELEDFKIVNEPTSSVYEHYNAYCIKNGYRPVSRIEFSKQINQQLNMRIMVTKINNKSVRVFVPNG